MRGRGGGGEGPGSGVYLFGLLRESFVNVLIG